MMSRSSRPNRPPSPACGLSPATRDARRAAQHAPTARGVRCAASAARRRTSPPRSHRAATCGCSPARCAARRWPASCAPASAPPAGRQMRRGLGLQQFGVAGKREARGRQRLLVQRRRDDAPRSRRASAARAAQTTQSPAMRPAAALISPSGDGRPRRARDLQHGNAARRHVGSACGGALDHGHRTAPARLAPRAPARRAARCRRRPRRSSRCVVSGASRKALTMISGADAGRIAERDRDRGGIALHAGLSMSMNWCARPSCAATCAATAGAP